MEPDSSTAHEGKEITRRLSLFLRRVVTRFPHLLPVAGLTGLCGAFFWDALWLSPGYVLGGEDLTNLFWHWLRFSLSSLKSGELPLWNPYLFSGTPFVANPQPALFYPPTWLATLMPLNRALGLIVLLHVWIAGMGMYAWLQSEGASKAGAMLGGTVFAFSGYFMVRIRGGHLGVVTTGSWLPVLLWFLSRASSHRHWCLAVVGGLPAGLSILAGHSASFVYVALALMAYAAFRAWSTWHETRSLHAALSPLLRVAVMIFLGLALAALQLLPTAQLVARSTRQASANYGFASRFSWPPGHLLTLLVPNLFGEPTQMGYWGDGIYDELVFYVGILPLLLALLGLKLRERLVPFLAILGFGGLLLAMGQYTVLHRLFYRFLPVFQVIRAPARAGYLFTLAAAALAGLTLSELQRAEPSDRLNLLRPVRWTWALPVVGGGCLLVIAGFAAFALGRETNPAAGRVWHMANQTTLFLFFLLLAVGLLIAWKKGGSVGRKGWLLALGLVVLDLWTFGNSTLEVRSVEESAYWRVVNQAVSDPQASRVLPWGLNEAEQNGGLPFGLRSVFGYDPLTLQRYEDFVTSSPDPMARTYDLLNAGYLVTTAPQTSSEDEQVPRLLSEQHGVYVYERPSAMPRVWIAPRAATVDKSATLTRIHNPQFDPRAVALTERPVACNGAGGEARIVEYEGNRVEVETQGAGGILVFSEIYYPGWQATIDGEDAQLFRADYVLRALCVPPGEHHVTLRYTAPLLKAGAVMSGMALLAVAIAAVWLARRRWCLGEN